MWDSRVARLLDRTPSHRFSQGEVAELRRWSGEVRAVVQRLALPEQCVLAVQESRRLDSDGLSREELVFRRDDGSTFTAMLVRPDEQTQQGAVVAYGADPDALALDGLTVLALSTVDEADDEALLLVGRSRLAAGVDDVLSALAWLRDHQQIETIGLYGTDAVVLHAALIAGGGAPVAVDAAIGSYTDAGNRELALPGILRYADLPDLYAALAPRPLWLAGENATVSGAYKAFGAEEQLQIGKPLASFFGNARVATPGIPPLKVHFGIPARLEIADRLDQVLASGMLTQGKLVVEFEKLAQRFTGAESIAVSTGTAALDIAYQLLNVAGKTVLAPVNTFFATAASIERMGGKVDFVDVELDGFGMDPQSLREALARHDDVAAVVVVHIGGIVAPSFKEVLAECAARGIPVVEDTAHALGATLDGQLAGTLGAMGTYSLHPAKVATSGEGGFFVAKDQAHLDAARKLRDHGKISIDKNVHDRLGNNWRLSEVHAAVGLAHFAQLDDMLAMRRALAAWYDENIDSVPRVKRYAIPTGSVSNYYKYMAILDPSIDRAELKARLRQRHGVSLAGEVYDVLLSDQPYFAERFAGRTFERAEWFTRHHICLPAFPSMTTAEQRHVLHALRTELS
ncbi:hypothetical protein Rhe02_62260 [Rhizocola hellebori]|uniref:DegT/DnrJ/EryC1/StrS aminotransferase n=2 Tax=Rhizocola hellebori TaxID=1392758 RepID=A0A8J3QCC5_9ACTN|nr:hypothetical protein Rhe02_62260 [Rhizocola hellebori]